MTRGLGTDLISGLRMTYFAGLLRHFWRNRNLQQSGVISIDAS